MITTHEITLKLVTKSTTPLDENAVKAAINAGMSAIVESDLQCIDDQSVESASVAIVKLKESGIPVNLDAYGTKEVPWGTD